MVKFSSKFAKQMGRKEILVPHLNNWFANGKFPDTIPFEVHPNKEKDDAFHPSSALACPQVLLAIRHDLMPHEKHDANSQKTFMIGHMYHGLVQWIIVNGLGFATEADIEKEHDIHLTTEAGNPYRVRGFIDVARCVIPGRGTYLVDVKTMHSRMFAVDGLGSLTDKYEAQVKLYLAFEELEDAIILQVQKDGPHQFKEYMVQSDPDFVDGIIAKWENVVDHDAAGTVPDCTCDDPSQCPAKGIYSDHPATASTR